MRDTRVLDIVFGGWYASTAADTGEVSVFRLLDLTPDAVHMSTYKQTFASVPSAAEVWALSPYIWHAPINARSLLRDDELTLICADSLSADDLEGYLVYLEAMGVEENDRSAIVEPLIGSSVEPVRVRLRLVDDELVIEALE